ncbi:MAG: chemotaxis protein CheA [Pseudomonadota bacterium]
MTPPDPMAEIRASFFVECDELLEAIQDSLQLLENGSGDSDTVHVLFRAVHSIKGGAGAFGLSDLVRFSHRYETVLDAVRSDKIRFEKALLNLCFRAADHLSDLVRAARDDSTPPENDAKLLAELDACIGPNGDTDNDEAIDFQPQALALDLTDETATTDPARYTITFAPDAEMFETGNDVYPILATLAGLGTCRATCDASKLPMLDTFAPDASYLTWTIQIETEVAEAELTSVFEFVEGLCEYDIARADDRAEIANAIEIAPSNTAPVQETQTTSPQNVSIVRVDLDRIERLVNLVGELVINQAMLAQSLQTVGLSPHSDAMDGLEEFQRLTRDIQDSVMMIRAQPVKSLFQRMSRIVRETSASVGKSVRLVTEGEATEVDKTVIECLADPLTHMIRNAVDHGLESTDDRLAAGKSPEGQVRLSAAHRSGRVIIEVSDDGGGINRTKVREIAVEKGLVPADTVLSDTETDNLLFLPGFSTSAEVSDLSGRGVGMDVVRTSIQALGGRISITSTPGVGTAFSISLPLTLAVLEGMVVEVAGETLVLPLNIVAETLTLTPATLETVQPGLDVVRVRGAFVPLFDLGHQLGYRARKDSYVDSVALLIAQEDGQTCALIVDEITDQRQVVIKGLDDTFYRAPGIAAATILGDGQIALILDPSDIIADASEALPDRAPNQKMESVT